MMSSVVLKTYLRCGLRRVFSIQERCRVTTSGSDHGERGLSEEDKRIPRAGKYRSPWKILKEEFEGIKTMKPAGTDVPRETDVLIVGGGVIGSSVAYWLKQWNPSATNIVIVERDPVYTRASTMLSAGGIRHQFSVPENVQLSMFATEFLRDIKEHLSVIHEGPPDVQFNHQGYLFLAPPRDAQQLAANVNMQQQLGARVELLSKGQLAEKFPWMNLEGIDCGSLGLEGEGWFDPWSLVRALKQKNISMGVKYVHGELTEFTFQTKEDSSETNKDLRLDSGVIRVKDGREFEVRFAMVVNCAGPWAADVAEIARIGTGDAELQIPLPVEPRKRFVFVPHCPDGPMLDCPFVVDPCGVYVRREGLGGHYICGCSPGCEAEEPEIANFDVDYEFYNEYIWPKLAERIPAFNNSKLKSAWAGYYEYNFFDRNLVIGPHPYHKNFFFANGLSGHGLQHALGIGRALMEYITEGDYQTIDLSRFHFDRFLSRQPIEESGIV
ncbi:FAD-dependent oxidoreductase domain-containing protein 1 [Aplysia californica]|uniref:FAD-dependent oxidoreductase domain-containing protein 1 n=1 Tax=Aplysia californica TaxID=6500 RepID=A0ABM0K566_APLCA|nr:FAD-dependent oxidoreductase domain-containing protein 1 [Aplysia californica]XP_035828443.1 FAD-dependent oxidoreductase domain-containing protein 1 [Aplysia californica]